MRSAPDVVADKPRGLGPCDVLTVVEAVAVLAMREADGRAWLRERELVHDVAGRERVIAGDLVDAIRGRDRGGVSTPTRVVAARRPLPLSDKF